VLLSQVHDGALLSAAMDPAGTMDTTGIANPAFIHTVGVLVMLASGFIITAMLWGGAVAFVIDRRLRRAAGLLFVAAVLAPFGFIHSVLPTGGIYWPWTTGSVLPWHWAVAYASVALLLLLAAHRVTPRPAEA
jgi:AGZA family xanthine/uracil permease-like MFS transporter